MSWSWENDSSNPRRKKSPPRVNVYRSSLHNILLSAQSHYRGNRDEEGVLAVVVRFPEKHFEILRERLSKAFEDPPLNGQDFCVFSRFGGPETDFKIIERPRLQKEGV